jgi:hypothetical protein
LAARGDPKSTFAVCAALDATMFAFGIAADAVVEFRT